MAGSEAVRRPRHGPIPANPVEARRIRYFAAVQFDGRVPERLTSRTYMPA